MYGKLDALNVLEGSSSFSKKFEGTELEGLGARLDTVIDMYNDGELDKGEAVDLIDDIRREQEIEALAESMQLRSDFLKAVDLLVTVL